MSKAVYRYPLRLQFREPETIEIERGAQIVRADFVNGVPSIWAVIDPRMVKDKRTFVIRGTGSEFDGDELYVGTFYTQDTPGGFNFVWHVFEVME